MKCGWNNFQFGHFFFVDALADRIAALVEFAHDPQSLAGGGARYKVHYRLVAGQWLAPPIDADKRE